MGNYNKVIVQLDSIWIILTDVIISDLIFSEWEDERTPVADIKFFYKEFSQGMNHLISSEQRSLRLDRNQEEFQKKPWISNQKKTVYDIPVGYVHYMDTYHHIQRWQNFQRNESGFQKEWGKSPMDSIV